MNTQKTSLEYSHFPVMLSEIIKFSSPSKGGTFLDCTFGGGGYSKALLNYSKTKVISFDRDIAVIDIAKKLEKKYQNRFKFYQLRFSQVNKIIKKQVQKTHRKNNDAKKANKGPKGDQKTTDKGGKGRDPGWNPPRKKKNTAKTRPTAGKGCMLER